MSEALAKVMKADQKNKKREDKQNRPKRSLEDRRALNNMRREAREKGAKLQSGGKGGLPASFVLGIFRRDDYTCKMHGDKGEGENGGLTVHHKGGIVESDWLSKKGHKLEPNNVVCICARGHDDIHNKARAEGNDSSQITPDGDKGTSRDHGK